MDCIELKTSSFQIMADIEMYAKMADIIYEKPKTKYSIK